MKNTLNNVLIFAVGAAIGSAVTYHFVKSKYEKEIASLVEDFAQHRYTGPQHRYTGPQDSGEAQAIEQNDIPEEEPAPTLEEEYKGMVKKLGYHNYSDVEPVHAKVNNDIPKEEESVVARVITPEEFGELDYKIVELSYWADGVLTDSKNKRIQDVGSLLGNTLERFGEHEPDALHVRNDEKKIDFEILRDLKRYSDFFDVDDPHQAEEE